MLLFGRTGTRIGAVEKTLAKVDDQCRGGGKRLLEKIEALEKSQEAQDSRMRLLKNEWEDVLDRANRVMGRLNARIRKFEGQNEPESDAEVRPQGLVPVVGSHTALAAKRGR